MTETFDAVLAEMGGLSDAARPVVAEIRPSSAVLAEAVKAVSSLLDRVDDWRERLAAAHAAELAERDARIAEAQETNRRLNRRVQMAEAAIPSYQKLIAIPPDGDGVRLANGSMGRALLTWYCEQLTERAEAAERDARQKATALQFMRDRFAPYMDDSDRAAIDAAIATTEQAAGGLVRDGGE